MRRAVAACRQARRAIIASIVTAVALWAASPAVGASALAWVALVPVAALVVRSPGSRESRIAVPLAYAVYLELLVVPALPFGLADRQWHEEPVGVLVGGSPVLVVALVVVPLLGALLYACRFGSAWGLEDRLGGRLRPLALVGVPALAWAGLDVLRAKADPTAFWGPLFLSQPDTAAAGLAQLGGPFAITLAIVACNYGLALLLVRRPGLGVAAAAAVTVSAGLADGVRLPSQPGRGPALSVAAVQPGWDTSEFERPELAHFRLELWELAALDMVSALAPGTREAAARGARLVVWPEAALWVDPRRDPEVRGALRRLARQARAILVVPYFLPGARRGACLAVLPDGSIVSPQPKRRPMWYLGERGQAGASQRPRRAGPFVLGTMLGVDSQDPAVARRLAGQGATLIASSAHDWEALSRPHGRLAQLHSRANRLPVVRADWRHGSAIYDRGRLVAGAGTARRRAVLVAAIRPGRSPTPYTHFGAAIEWALAGVLAAGGAVAAARFVARRATRSRRRLRPASPPTAASR